MQFVVQLKFLHINNRDFPLYFASLLNSLVASFISMNVCIMLVNSVLIAVIHFRLFLRERTVKS